MFTLILVYLLFPLCGSKANTGSSAGEETCQQDNYCITLRKGVISAGAGLCAVIPCSFTTAFKTTKIIWFKCATENANCANSEVIFRSNYPRGVVQSGFEGRVSLMEPDVNQKNCSIIINDLKKTDSGFYQLRVEGSMSNQGYLFKNKTYLSVKDLTQKPTVMIPPLTEGQQTTLSCTAPGLCSGSAPEITWTWRGGGLNESTRKISADDMKDLNIVTKGHTSSLTFTPSAEHHGTNITCYVSFQNSISTEKTQTLEVTYLKAPVIRGHRAVKLGAALNLTCSVDSFPPSVVTWTKLGSNKTLKENTRTAKLIIPYMTAEDVGKFICSASQQITKQTARTEVNVTILSSILNSSACEVQSEVLTCVCISQGFPLPTIEWPLLKKHTHCITTSVINNTVKTNISVSVRDLSYTTVVCVSRNVFGEVEKELKVVIKNVTKSESEEEEEPPLNLLGSMKQPQVIIAFLIGVLLSAAVCCSVQKCHRKKQKMSRNLSTENLEMMDVDPALVSGGRHGQGGAEGGAEADEEPREVEYSDINLDMLKRGRPIGAERGETSEYAEIKKDAAGRVQVNDGGDGEVMEGNQEEKVTVEERKDDVAEKEEEESEGEEEEEEEALYSNVKDLMKKV